MVRDLLRHSSQEAIQAIQQLKSPTALNFMEATAEALAETYRAGGKVLLAGNGGSLCDAAHFAEELTGYFRKARKALSAIVLNDPGHITCVGNDVGFESIFSRGIEAHGKAGDLFIGLTTSGNSKNIVEAFRAAKACRLKTVAFLGKQGGVLKGVADIEWIVEGFEYSDRIQEIHMTGIHLIIEALEELLFHAPLSQKMGAKEERQPAEAMLFL